MRIWVLGATLTLLFASGSAHAQRLAGPVSTWIVAEDYPAEDVAKGRGGVVNMHFRITATGRVENCKPQFASTSAQLARLSCQLIEARARYLPAHDAVGNPVASEGELIARWDAQARSVDLKSQFGGAMPIGSPGGWMTDDDYLLVTQGRGDGDVSLIFDIGTDGRLTGCAFAATSNAETGKRTCQLLAQRARFHPPVGDHGEPLATQGSITMHWRH
jgi:hypothetical protein